MPTNTTRTAAIAAVALAATAHAGYVASVVNAQDGSNLVGVLPGRTFNVDVRLDADPDGPQDVAHNSAIIRLIADVEGLIVNAVTWQAPYENGTFFDDSTPSATDLPLPLTADTLTGTGYPDDVIDMQLSNVVDTGTFATGIIASIEFELAADYAGPIEFNLSVDPDTIADGFEIVETTAANPLTIFIPAPGAALAIAGVALTTAARRRR